MNHYILNGSSDVENWVEKAEYMTEEQLIATAPIEVLEFAAELQASGEEPNNLLGFGLLTAGKALVKGAATLGKKVAPKLIKKVSKVPTNLANKAKSWIKRKPTAPKVSKMPTVKSPDKFMAAPLVRTRQAEAPAATAEKKPFYTNPLFLAAAGGAVLLMMNKKKKRRY